MVLTDVEALLTSVMRSIDKKIAIKVVPSSDTNRPGVTVALSCGRRSGTLEVAEADIDQARKEPAARHRLRSAMKRARDRMWNEPGHIFSTKLERAKLEGSSWFRPQQGGRGRR
ncbi:hypothetical protein L6Q96_00160 [Candidatus Binatia bacterium]|nr:hypothetical protein [Candidatus Binatia bacterium]